MPPALHWRMIVPDTPTPPAFRELCRIELVCPDPRGGQHAGSSRYGMVVTHEPTGIAVTIPSGYTRSQHKQRQLALSAIEWILAND